MNREKMLDTKYELKAVIIFLNIIIWLSLFFASYSTYAQYYSSNDNMLPFAVGSEITHKSGDLLVVQSDEKVTTSGKIVIEPIDIILYKFEESTPQPMSYYTDLLKIQNTSNQSTLINIRIERIHGQENLGSILIWFFDNQTNTPNTDISISNAKITNTTTGTIDFVSNYLMKPNHTYFIELAGFASMNSIEGSKITFDFAIEQSQKE